MVVIQNTRRLQVAGVFDYPVGCDPRLPPNYSPRVSDVENANLPVQYSHNSIGEIDSRSRMYTAESRFENVDRDLKVVIIRWSFKRSDEWRVIFQRITNLEMLRILFQLPFSASCSQESRVTLQLRLLFHITRRTKPWPRVYGRVTQCKVRGIVDNTNSHGAVLGIASLESAKFVRLCTRIYSQYRKFASRRNRGVAGYSVGNRFNGKCSIYLALSTLCAARLARPICQRKPMAHEPQTKSADANRT